MISTEHKQEMLSQVESPLSMRSKCVLLSLNRSSQYYTKKTDESDLNLELMAHMDKMYTDHPEYGAERMHTWLTMDLGFAVNIKRINRLYYEVMGLKSLMPGARTNWHYHPGGQILMITEGIGYYQEKGSPIRWMRKGDVIKCPHNVEHWHGASPKTGVTHLAISTNTNLGAAVWLKPVTKEEYGKNAE